MARRALRAGRLQLTLSVATPVIVATGPAHGTVAFIGETRLNLTTAARMWSAGCHTSTMLKALEKLELSPAELETIDEIMAN